MALPNKELEKRVKSFTKNKSKNKKSGVDKLPSKFRKIMHGINGRDENGKAVSRNDSKTIQTQSRALNQLSKSDRAKLFKQLRPKLAAELELTWNFFEQLPVANDSTSGPFRAPKNRDLIIDRRTQWPTNSSTTPKTMRMRSSRQSGSRLGPFT